MSLIQLHGGSPWRKNGLDDRSPFAQKLILYCRMFDIPFEYIPGGIAQAPKGKIPWIEDDSKKIGDSSLVIKYLNSTRNINPDADLTNEEKAISQSFKVMMEEFLIIAAGIARYLDDEGFKSTSADMPDEVAKKRRALVETFVIGQGLGIHTREEQREFLSECVEAVSVYLGDKQFFFGRDHPTVIDATIGSFLLEMLIPDLPFSYQLVAAYPNLQKYANNIMKKYITEFRAVDN